MSWCGFIVDATVYCQLLGWVDKQTKKSNIGKGQLQLP
jgi:hypothetical protein